MPTTVKVVISEHDAYPVYSFHESDNNLSVDVTEETIKRWNKAIENWEKYQAELKTHFRKIGDAIERQKLELQRRKLQKQIDALGEAPTKGQTCKGNSVD